MLTRLIIILLVTISVGSAQAQLNTLSFEAVDSSESVEERNTVIFLKTDWCKYCHKMEQTTLKNEDVVELLNSKFYLVNFDAESERDVVFRGRKFVFKPTGNNTGVHEIAEQLGTVDGKLNYPAIAIINAKSEIVFQYGGYLSAKELLRVLIEVKE